MMCSKVFSVDDGADREGDIDSERYRKETNQEKREERRVSCLFRFIANGSRELTEDQMEVRRKK